MKLYGYIGSPYVVRAVLMARWKGCALELTAPPGGNLKSAEFLRINPIGKMPALEDAGSHLAESTVICEYIDETQPGRKLLGDGPMERAQARLLARIMDVYVVPNFGALFRNLDPAKRNDAEVQAAIAGVRKALGHLDHFMGPGPWAIGKEPGYADVILAPEFYLAAILLPMFGMDDPCDGQPKLTRWWQTLQADPVAAAVRSEFDVSFRAFMAARLKAP